MSAGFDPELDEVARASNRPAYNTAVVEQRTGLRPATFRAWERRYGFPKPRRLPGNQRLYSDQDLAAIRWLQRRTDEGLAISHAIRLLQDQLAEGTVSLMQPIAGRPLAAITMDFERALLAFDSQHANTILAEAFALYSLEDVCLEIMQPALVDIGDRWHHGETTVATEHFATSFVRRKLFTLLNAFETGRGRGSIFAACAPDEWHEVGLLMLSLFLVRHGFRVSYLGPNLAVDGFGETVRRQHPDLVCVSATSARSAERVEEIWQAVQRLPTPRPRFAYGGLAFEDPTRREATPGVYLGPDATSAVEIIEQILRDTTEVNGGQP